PGTAIDLGLERSFLARVRPPGDRQCHSAICGPPGPPELGALRPRSLPGPVMIFPILPEQIFAKLENLGAYWRSRIGFLGRRSQAPPGTSLRTPALVNACQSCSALLGAILLMAGAAIVLADIAEGHLETIKILHR